MKCVRDNLSYLLLIAVCPVSAYLGMLLMMVADYSSRMFAVGFAGLNFCLLLLLPVGVLCLFLSWKLSKNKNASSTDAHNLIEFLLGASGLMTVSLGATLSRSAFHMTLWFFE